MRLALLRHGLTGWNLEQRIQGQTETALSAAGRRQVAGWQLPPELREWSWYCSPLLRARSTAALLGIHAPRLDARLCEMHWGQWQGRQLAALRRTFAAELARNEARGLDFRPPCGESPREVQARLRAWCAERARAEPALGQDLAAVTHKGVIRAAYAAATGWDMRRDPAHALQWDAVHLFRVGPDGELELDCLNLTLVQTS